MEAHMAIPKTLSISSAENKTSEIQLSPFFGQKIERASLKIKGSYSPGWSAIHSRRWRDHSDENIIESESDENVEAIDCTVWTRCKEKLCVKRNRHQAKRNKKDK